PLSVRLIAALRILPYLLFFTLVIRQPPWPTPFPYTTLFRSVDRQAQSRLPEGRQRWRRGPVRRDRRGVGLFGGIRRTSRTGEAGDRKSTRLNSSHRTISYAVFCLKKKNEMQYFPYYVDQIKL